MTLRSLLLSLGALLLLAPVHLVLADGEAEPAQTAALETRFYDVWPFTWGAPGFSADAGPYPRLSDMGDESGPLFGGEWEERIRPLGSSSDLCEWIGASLGLGEASPQGGPHILACGESRLIVRAARRVQDAVADLLAAAARRVLSTVVVDLAVLAGESEILRGAGGLAQAVAGGRVRVLAYGRSLVQAGGCAVARDGAMRAVLGDVDVEVAEDARAPDPVVAIVPDGMACEAQVAAVSADRLTVRVRGWWAAPPTITPYRTKEGDVLEIPATDGRSFEAMLAVSPGVWDVVPLAGGIVLAVRARADPPATTAEDASGYAVPTVDRGTAVGPLVSRRIDVAPLGEPLRSGRGERLAIWPSNYTPPLPPELAEAAPIFPVDTLPDLIRSVVLPGLGAVEGASVEFRSGGLLLRHDEAGLAAVQRLVNELRARYTRTTRARASIVTLPVASLPELWTGLDDALVADGGDGLLRRTGARLVDSLGVRLWDGQRQASLSGSLRRYVGDFDVEIACKSSIANPTMREALDGTSLDLMCVPLGRGPELRLELRLDRGTVREMRQATSMHGPIQCPVYDVLRCLGSFTVRSGTTRIVGASSSGGDVTLVLLTATRE